MEQIDPQNPEDSNHFEETLAIIRAINLQQNQDHSVPVPTTNRSNINMFTQDDTYCHNLESASKDFGKKLYERGTDDYQPRFKGSKLVNQIEGNYKVRRVASNLGSQISPKKDQGIDSEKSHDLDNFSLNSNSPVNQRDIPTSNQQNNEKDQGFSIKLENEVENISEATNQSCHRNRNLNSVKSSSCPPVQFCDVVRSSKRLHSFVLTLISEFKESLNFLGCNPNLKTTFWRKYQILQELLQQEAFVLSAHSEITMGKLLSLVEGIDDNLKETIRKPVSKDSNSPHHNPQSQNLEFPSETALSPQMKTRDEELAIWPQPCEAACTPQDNLTHEETHEQSNKKLKYCVARLYNWLSIMETIQGKKQFAQISCNIELQKDTKAENIESVLRRNIYKGYLDILDPVCIKKGQRLSDSDWPDIAPREKTQKLRALDGFIKKRVNFMLKEKQLMDLRCKMAGIPHTRVCRICNKDIKASRLLSHSTLCLEIKKLEIQLQEVNNQLLAKAEIAKKRKNEIGFNTLMSYQDKKNCSKKTGSKKTQHLGVPGEDYALARKGFSSRRCLTQYSRDLVDSTASQIQNPNETSSNMSREDEKKALQEILDIKMTQKVGQKPLKPTVFAKQALEEKKLQMASDNPGTDQLVPTVKKTQDSDLISQKSIDIDDKSAKSEYSCFGDLVWNFMGNQMTYGKNVLDRRRNSTVKSSVEISSLPMVDDVIKNASEAKTAQQSLQDPESAHDQGVEGDGASSIAHAAKFYTKDDTKLHSDLKSTPLFERDDPGTEPQEKPIKNEKQNVINSDLPRRNVGLSKMDLSAQNSIKNKIIMNKRAQFEKKSKKKESSTFYVKSKDKHEQQADSPDFQRELNVLRLEKELYSEIAKYGSELHKHWDGQLLTFDSSMSITLQNLIDREILQDEAHQFAEEFNSLLQKRMELRKKLKGKREEEELMLARSNMNQRKADDHDPATTRLKNPSNKIHSNSFNQKSNNNRIDYFTDQRENFSQMSDKKHLAIGDPEKRNQEVQKAVDKRNIFKAIGKVKSFTPITLNEQKRSERLGNRLSTFRHQLSNFLIK